MSKLIRIAVFNYTKDYSKFLERIKFTYKNYKIIFFYKEKNRGEKEYKYLQDKILNKLDVCVICELNENSFFINQINFLIKNYIKIVQAVNNSEIDKHGLISPKPIKSVRFEDLFLRKNNSYNFNNIKKIIKNKKILITGGAGSIGGSIFKALLKYNPGKVLLLDNNEYALFRLLNFGFVKTKNNNFDYVICNIENKGLLNLIFIDFKPDIVFHAAALKHVDFLEKNPVQASLTNIIGTENVLNSAISVRAKFFINISSDKAVHPKSILGKTKRISELLCSSQKSNRTTKICSIRFGNVFDSRGSLSELVREKILSGEKIKISSPIAERYFMSQNETSDLILNSVLLMSKEKDYLNDKIYIFDMGQPVNIKNLVYKMIYLTGRDIKDFIFRGYYGLKSGEKIKENLFNSKEEIILKKFYNKIYQIKLINNKSFLKKYLNLKKIIKSNNKKLLLKSLSQLSLK